MRAFLLLILLLNYNVVFASEHDSSFNSIYATSKNIEFLELNNILKKNVRIKTPFKFQFSFQKCKTDNCTIIVRYNKKNYAYKSGRYKSWKDFFKYDKQPNLDKIRAKCEHWQTVETADGYGHCAFFTSKK